MFLFSNIKGRDDSSALMKWTSSTCSFFNAQNIVVRYSREYSPCRMKRFFFFILTTKKKDVPISVLCNYTVSQASRAALHFYLNRKKANADFSWQNCYLMPSWLAKVIIFYLWSSTKSRCICPCFLASISSVLCYFLAIWQRQQDLLKNTSISLSLIKHGYPVTIGPQLNKKCMKVIFGQIFLS